MGLVTASSIKFDLRALDRVIGYYVYDNQDRDVAPIQELLVDSETRKPRYVVIEIGGMLSIRGKKALIPWNALTKAGMSRMDVNCPAEQIIAAPAPRSPLAPTRPEEETLHWYFNVEPYWLGEEPNAPAKEGEGDNGGEK
ncbi:MAG: PRC-barrel domain-containing protein [Nitrospinae bacterium]|nr:PRC-barrel domain-containing protein [Nitrospinota bacterium]